MKFNPVKFNWLVLCVLIVIAAVPAYFLYQARDKQHPCYDPDFVPVIPDSITLPDGLDLEPITVENAARIVQLDSDIAIDEFLYVLNDRALVAKPMVDDTAGIFADASLASRDSRSPLYETEENPHIPYTLEGDRLGAASLSYGSSYTDFAFSPNGRCIAFGGGVEAIRFWEFDANAEVGVLSNEGFLDKLLSLPTRATIATVDFDDKGRFLAYGNYGDNDSSGGARAGVWDLARSKEILHFTTTDLTQHVSLSQVAISADGQFMVAAEGNGIITVWDIEQESRMVVMQGPEGHIRRVLFGRGNRLIALGNYDCEIRFWDATTGELIIGLDVSQSTDMAFSPDMRLLVTIDFEGVVRYWGVPVGE